ncbi:MAG: adenine deaminase C-terminal domain-containing protein, partial [Halobacteriaceae archaeon]
TVVVPEMECDDFTIKVNQSSGHVTTPVIVMEESEVTTSWRNETFPIRDGRVVPSGVSTGAVIERHSDDNSIGVGFISGFDLDGGAIATTFAHDSHNLIVIGQDLPDMVSAVNRLDQLDGGLICVKDGSILAELPLPIAGLMSERKIEIVKSRLSELEEAGQTMGCEVENPFMNLSL